MKRSLLLALAALVAAVPVWMFCDLRGQPATGTAPAAADATPSTAGLVAEPGPSRAQVVHGSGSALDPDRPTDERYRRALGGFRGRLLDPESGPLPGQLVRLYRYSIQSLVRPGADAFAAEATAAPAYTAGWDRTDDAGRFEIVGTLPRALHLLHAAVGHPHATFRALTATASPGEVVDLGDILLEAGGSITGRVLDPDGDALSGAVIRAVDLPAGDFADLSLERFDPRGGLIAVNDLILGDLVAAFPPWVAIEFARLPIPQTVSGADGGFRLCGSRSGQNVVVVTRPGLVAEVRTHVAVAGGAEQDIGDVLLSAGGSAHGVVVDADGRPVESAEVLVAAKSPGHAEVHLASRAPPTNGRGEFELGGFRDGEVLVAARRGAGEPWSVSGCQPIEQEVRIVLSAERRLTVHVRDARGRSRPDAWLRLLPLNAPHSSLGWAMFGITDPIELGDRRQGLDDGSIVLARLPDGDHTLLATAPGCGRAIVDLDLDRDLELDVDLPPARAFDVLVLDPDGRPLACADVMIEARGPGQRGGSLHTHAGWTDRDGLVHVGTAPDEYVEVIADHPEFGAVWNSVTVPADGPVVLRFEAPGTVEGVLSVAGTPPVPGQWMLALEGRHHDAATRPRAVPADDGTFAFRGVAPGSYSIQAFDTRDTIHSLNDLMRRVGRHHPATVEARGEVAVVAGQTVRLDFDLAHERNIDGPSARIRGQVRIDGRPATDHWVVAAGARSELTALIGSDGGFSLGEVEPGEVELRLVTLQKSRGSDRHSMLWQRVVRVVDGVDQRLTIDLRTAALGGLVRRIDGSPAAGVQVFATATIGNGDGSHGSRANASTDRDGRFRMSVARGGPYSIEARSDEQRGRSDGVWADGNPAAMSLEIALVKTFEVSGRVDRQPLGRSGASRVEIEFWRLGSAPWSAVAELDRAGNFRLASLAPGTYEVRVRLVGTSEAGSREWRHREPIAVRSDLTGVAIEPIAVERTR